MSTKAIVTSLEDHAPPTTAARLDSATKVYDAAASPVRAIDGITLAFEEGKFTAIMGPSGSGKSTLIQCLAGLDRLTTGNAFVGDTDLTTLSDSELTLLRRSHVGFVFQAFNLLPALSAEENILLPLMIGRNKPTSGVFDHVVHLLGLTDRLDHRPSELSGGQQQRVAIARALITEPQLVVADEPTGNLDSASGKEILGLLRDAADGRGQTTVMVTHDPAAAAWADRVITVVDGQIYDDRDKPSLDEITSTITTIGRQ